MINRVPYCLEEECGLTNQNQSCLRFSLEESIWFPKGQEVNELYSLAIEPDVTISEINQYVNIKGNLEVVGEYRGIPLGQEEALDGADTAIQASHVQNIEYRQEDGMYCFTHCFPVDISIQASRVENREAIEVDISSFDYNMPESSCIKLYAELLITGVYDGSEEQYQPVGYAEAGRNEYPEIPEFMPAQEEEPVYESLSFDEPQSFEASAYAQPKEESEGARDDVQPFPFLDQQIPFFPKFPMPSFEKLIPPQEFNSHVSAEDNTQQEPSAGLLQEEEIPFHGIAHPAASHREEEVPKQADGENVEVPILAEPHQEEIIPEPVRQEVTIPYVSAVTEQKAPEIDPVPAGRDAPEQAEADDQQGWAEDIQAHEDSGVRLEMNIQQKAAKDESSIHTRPVSLTDFFANKETVSHTKLKVCILQDGETIQQVAERYSISTHELLFCNKMNDENDAAGGKVLYIPRTVSNK